jgi:hypothetical protein
MVRSDELRMNPDAINLGSSAANKRYRTSGSELPVPFQ